MARFSRQLLLPGFGEVAQRRLQAARVLVVGAGGLGSAAVPYLAGAGVGTIGIADPDVVELSNLHRQTAHAMSDIGRRKVDSLADTIAAIDPEIAVTRHPIRLNSANILGILADYDLIVDGSDNFPTRYLTNDAATLAGKPLVWGAILRYSGQASVAWADHGPTYRDLFPTPPAADEVLSCEFGGVLPGVCAAIGAILATEVVKVITGTGEPLIGRVTTFDALTGRYREIAYQAIPDAAPVTTLIDYEQFCGVSPTPNPAPAATAPADTAPGGTAPGVKLPTAIGPQQLAELLHAGTPLQLIDVREPIEAQISRIPSDELIPLGDLLARSGAVRSDVPVVFYCHLGPRSVQAVRMLRSLGHDNVSYLAGGVNAYAVLDPSVGSRY
ncbi:MAG: molybdopterin biosynthesis protein MoeB [Microbacteriaceae bacterium]|nr:MAG: molybdopterin biosynthesis protein MoeB [Microbacteriaceae bacterium]